MAKLPKHACCDWLEFITTVRRLWNPAWGQFSHIKAREAWSRYAATGAEFVAQEKRERGLA